MSPRPPFVARLLLRCVPLGDDRDEVESDVAELFELRRRERGRVHAYRRLFGDLGSVLRFRSNRSNLSNLPNLPNLPNLSNLSNLSNLGLLQDVRHGLRLFRRHPAVVGATVAGLALAIAVATTVFTLINATVLRPYGMDDPASVVRVEMAFQNGIANSWPYHAFATMREHARTTELAASFRDTVGVGLSATEAPARADSLQFVTGGYLPMLGGRAKLGRTLMPSDDAPGAPPIVVLHHRFWLSRFGGDTSLVGRTIWLSGIAVTVAGVLEPAFTGPTNSPPAMWAPFGTYGAITRHRSLDRTSTARVTITGRVSTDVARSVAQQELSAIAAGLPDLALPSETGVAAPVVGVRLDSASSPVGGADSVEILAAIGAILLLVGLVLALACANVANLLLAGAASRAREIGVRLAMGASRRRILRQLLSESLLIGLMAGAAGLLLSLWLVPLVAASELPATVDLRPDFSVLLFTIGISILAGAGAGLAPARHGSSGDLTGVLKSQSASGGSPTKTARLRRVFIGFQAAASILLLVTAALFVRAALHVVRVDFGFDASRLVTVAPIFPAGFEAPAIDAYWRSALDRLRTMPAVEQVTLASSPPFGGLVAIREVGRLKQSGLTYRLYENRTDDVYFTTTGMRLLKGRSYTADEVRTDAPVAVVSESVVRDFFADSDPIGASLSAVSSDLSAVTIIGVAAEAVTARARGRGNGTIYRPLARPSGEVHDARLVIRAANPHAMVRDLDTVLAAVDASVRTNRSIMSRDVDEYLEETAVLAGIAGAVAGLALLLAVTGLYGVTTFVVGQRMWEMQVRRAIGASAPDIVRLLVRQNLMPVLIGLVTGLAAALAVVRVLAPALSGISPYDPAAIGGAVAVLLTAATTAVVLPALRAAHADPAGVLRQS